jgi:hypothetical protein
MGRKCSLAMLLIALAFLGVALISGGRAVAQAQLGVAVIDESPPIIETFAIEPTRVDTGGQSQSITVTMAVSDLGSGVDGGACGINAKFVGPSEQPLQFIFCHGVAGEPDALIRDDEFLGIWQRVGVLPAHSEPGEWKIDEVLLVDKSGNSAILSYQDMLNYKDPPFPVSFRVANTYELSIPIVFRQYAVGAP